ncbi:MAG: dNTP triphosphohydrolase [Bacteroidota bacterium]|nr:dNTP triphosphohydrolase [Bacteroidota bacterium]
MNLEERDLDYIKVNLKNYDEINHYRVYEEEKIRERDPYQRDYARILYSSSFRRLQGKMQLLAITSMDFHRNRLTHSYEVAQIARSITEYINEKIEDSRLHIPIYVVEAASLAHDIGNPPFGHYGEYILNKLSTEVGGFEGNAQTLRILMNLECKIPNQVGLNLTARTLLATIKYYQKRTNSKKFIYDKDYDTISEIIKNFKISPRTIEAQIMDLSDEIAYAAHDLEDALSHGFFTIDDLLFEFQNSEKYQTAHLSLLTIVEKSKETARKCQSKSSETYNFYFKKELTSNIVNTLIKDIGLCRMDDTFKKKTGTQQAYELNYKTLAPLSEGLKKLTFNCIKRSDVVQLYEKQGEIILTRLLDVYMNQNYNKGFDLLPAEYRPKSNDENSLKRCVIDYLSGMMDSYAISTYDKFFGQGASEIKYLESITPQQFNHNPIYFKKLLSGYRLG